MEFMPPSQDPSSSNSTSLGCLPPPPYLSPAPHPFPHHCRAYVPTEPGERGERAAFGGRVAACWALHSDHEQVPRSLSVCLHP